MDAVGAEKNDVSRPGVRHAHADLDLLLQSKGSGQRSLVWPSLGDAAVAPGEVSALAPPACSERPPYAAEGRKLATTITRSLASIGFVRCAW
jgi:hypothetical protein